MEQGLEKNLSQRRAGAGLGVGRRCIGCSWDRDFVGATAASLLKAHWSWCASVGQFHCEPKAMPTKSSWMRLQPDKWLPGLRLPHGARLMLISFGVASSWLRSAFCGKMLGGIKL